MTLISRPDRRDLLAAPLLAMAGTLLGAAPAQAAGVDPAMTIVVPPDRIPWQPLYNVPAGMAEQAAMFGRIGDPGQSFVLIRWHQGSMSAPHDDGVIKGAPEPAVIAITGLGPIHHHLTDPSKPGWREV